MTGSASCALGKQRSGAAPARVLAVSGSDSGGGAGMQADLKTMQELGVFGMSALTAITAQNSMGVQQIFSVPPGAVKAQLHAVLSDIGANALKTGMLHTAANVIDVVEALQLYPVPHVVVDPVLAASDGSLLLLPEAQQALTARLFPAATMITPNVPEACLLLERPLDSIGNERQLLQTARCLLDFGSQYVLLKGGHLYIEDNNAQAVSVDVLVSRQHTEPIFLRSERIDTAHSHGTGCTLASAVAAFLAHGYEAGEAARAAKRYMISSLRGSFSLGAGRGALSHSAHRACF